MRGRMVELQRAAKDREKHLYLMLDDWHSGYSIRKLSLSLSPRSGEEQKQQHSSSSGSGAADAEPLPAPFMRIRADRGSPQFFQAAFGTKILAMHPSIAADFKGIPMIDVEELTMDYGPQLTPHAFPIFLPVGDNKLFAMDIGSFDCYLWMPECSEQQWVCKYLPLQPFEKWDVTSYGVHPDSGCLLLSTTKGGVKTTFVYDTNEYVWRSPCFGYVFPFTGRGHYDTSLEGFVGLSKADPETLGYLYCCSTIRTGDNTLHPCPADFIKCSKEKVFNKHPAAERHLGATLVHIGPGRFCLVECVSSIDNDGNWADQEELRWKPEAVVGEGGCVMYRLRTFTLGYDEKGDLKLKDCQVRCYMLPEHVTRYFLLRDPPAFWL